MKLSDVEKAIESLKNMGHSEEEFVKITSYEDGIAFYTDWGFYVVKPNGLILGFDNIEEEA